MSVTTRHHNENQICGNLTGGDPLANMYYVHRDKVSDEEAEELRETIGKTIEDLKNLYIQLQLVKHNGLLAKYKGTSSKNEKEKLWNDMVANAIKAHLEYKVTRDTVNSWMGFDVVSWWNSKKTHPITDKR